MKKMIKKQLKKYAPLWFLEEPGKIYGWDKKQLIKLKNKWKGEKCIIIGNGPSLNKIDFNILKGKFTFGVNGIFYKSDEIKDFKPYFYVVEDTAVMLDNAKRINEYECEYKFFPSIYKKHLINRKNTLFFNLNRGFYDSRSEFHEFPRFSPGISKRIYAGQSVTMVNLQLAYYFGFQEVYLIGMDFEYNQVGSEIIEGHRLISQEDDINHFHPDYFGKGKVWHDPKLHNVLKSYKLIKSIYEINGRKIYNSTVGGKLEIFERKELSDAFN